MRHDDWSVLLGPIAAGLLVACAASPRAGTAEPGRLAGDPAPRRPEDSALVAVVDSFTRARVAIDSFSGVVVLARDEKTLYSHSAGFADRAAGTRNGPSTKFNLASNDKYFTRIAIRRLQQAGKLTMSDLVGRHLPDYPTRGSATRSRSSTCSTAGPGCVASTTTTTGRTERTC
jgi:CubicO group peptidase (beta-lactamase class C family)